MAREHPRLVDSRGAGEDDDRRAVLRRDVAGGQVEAVARRHGHGLERDPELRQRTSATDVRIAVREADREDDVGEAQGGREHAYDHRPRAPEVPLPAAPSRPSVPPERHRPARQQDDTACDRQQTAVVRARGAAVEQVVRAGKADRDPDRTERHRRGRAHAGTEPRVHPKQPSRSLASGTRPLAR